MHRHRFKLPNDLHIHFCANRDLRFAYNLYNSLSELWKTRLKQKKCIHFADINFIAILRFLHVRYICRKYLQFLFCRDFDKLSFFTKVICAFVCPSMRYKMRRMRLKERKMRLFYKIFNTTVSGKTRKTLLIGHLTSYNFSFKYFVRILICLRDISKRSIFENFCPFSKI